MIFTIFSQQSNMAPNLEDLRKTAFNAEKDLNSYQAKQGLGPKSDSSKLTDYPFTNLRVYSQSLSSRVRGQ